MHRPETVTEQLQLEKTMLEIAQKEWSRLEPLGSSYSPQVQKDVCRVLLICSSVHIKLC